jgi:hypothetical protein
MFFDDLVTEVNRKNKSQQPRQDKIFVFASERKKRGKKQRTQENKLISAVRRHSNTIKTLTVCIKAVL